MKEQNNPQTHHRAHPALLMPPCERAAVLDVARTIHLLSSRVGLTYMESHLPPTWLCLVLPVFELHADGKVKATPLVFFCGRFPLIPPNGDSWAASCLLML